MSKFSYLSKQELCALTLNNISEGGELAQSLASLSINGWSGFAPARSACHRTVEFYHCVIDSLPPVPMTGSEKVVHVLLCLCNSACKRSLAICFCMSLYSLHVLNRDVNMNKTKIQHRLVVINMFRLRYQNMLSIFHI